MKFILALLFLLSLFVYFLFAPKHVEKKTLLIRKGESVILIAEKLEKEGIIRTRASFILIHILLGRSLRYGEYEFEGYVSPLQVYRKIAEGRQKLYKVLIPEGSDIYDIARILSEQDLVKEEDFLIVANSSKMPKRFGLETSSMEGFLFPDTYFFTKGMSPEQMIEAMYFNFLKRTKKLRDELKSKGLSLEEWVTIASLIEKETHLEEEKPLIASVIFNRLKKGMKLQIDPTVIYALKRKGLWRGKLTKENLKIEDPYNTYLYKGLPPTPICNPGISSLKAVLYPANTDYLYFVFDPRIGKHRFSSSYKEHITFINQIKKDLRY